MFGRNSASVVVHSYDKAVSEVLAVENDFGGARVGECIAYQVPENRRQQRRIA